MAKQTGPIKFTGSVGELTGYKMNGKHYLKKKSGVKRQRILTDPKFSNTMRNANWFATAKKIAAEVYHTIPPCERDWRETWYPMTNRAQELVRNGFPKEEIIGILKKEFVEVRKDKQTIDKPAMQPQPGNHKPKNINYKPKTAEIILGREINRNVEYSLIDQLAAASLLISKILNDKKGEQGCFGSAYKRPKVLERFRRMQT